MAVLQTSDKFARLVIIGGDNIRDSIFRMKKRLLVFALTMTGAATLLANGGAWQEGVPGTGTASASDKKHKTDVAIEDESLTIDLHPESAAVQVRYHMHNTGPKVEQDFFFPVERWGTPPGEETRAPAELDQYHVSVDGKELKWMDVRGPKEKETEKIVPAWDENAPIIKSWKKSVIPFEHDQTRDVTIKYNSRYSANNESVSDDEHISDAVLGLAE